MLEFALNLATLAGKIVLFLIAIKIFWSLITKGKGIFSDMVDTIFMGMRTLTKKLQRWLFLKYKGIGKEESKPEPKKEESTPPAPEPAPTYQPYQPQPEQSAQVPPPYQW